MKRVSFRIKKVDHTVYETHVVADIIVSHSNQVITTATLSVPLAPYPDSGFYPVLVRAKSVEIDELSKRLKFHAPSLRKALAEKAFEAWDGLGGRWDGPVELERWIGEQAYVDGDLLHKLMEASAPKSEAA